MIWFIIATLVAFFIKGLCGFANTLIFNGILSYTANNINISPLEVVLGYPSNIILVWKERKSLNWKIWLPLTALVLAGSIPGIFFPKQHFHTNDNDRNAKNYFQQPRIRMFQQQKARWF